MAWAPENMWGFPTGFHHLRAGGQAIPAAIEHAARFLQGSGRPGGTPRRHQGWAARERKKTVSLPFMRYGGLRQAGIPVTDSPANVTAPPAASSRAAIS